MYINADNLNDYLHFLLFFTFTVSIVTLNKKL
ncbi:hypothetical protein DES51_10261 [Dielma fastidiosa]|uniref:Uncharacterized protein n=1 Tax=Dielma fastidiosa TaxID=1034346 RepID=A0A318L612_9FIRM|nr:hypothetical protein DES51_10261 [Dielma fastidiosa]